MLDSAQVDYRPTMINLTHVINIVTKELMGTIKAVSRVREVLGDGPNPNASTSNIKKSAPAAAAGTGATDASGAAAATEPTEAPPGAPAASLSSEREREGGATGAAGVSQAAGEGVGGEGGGDGGSLLPVAQVRAFQRRDSFPDVRAGCIFYGVHELCCPYRCRVGLFSVIFNRLWQSSQGSHLPMCR